MVAKVAAVPLLADGTLAILAMTVASDTTVVNGSAVRRTLALTTTAEADARFPTDSDKIAATVNLCKAQLELNLATTVQAATPVVT
jgi:hypothetical protein